MTSQTLTIQTDDARLTARVDYTDDALTIHYQLTNRTMQDLYVFNKLFDKVEAGVVLTDKNLAYVYPNGGQVIISKAMAAVPTNRKVEYVRIPALTKIPALSDSEETFTVRLPLTLKTPYQQPDVSSAIAQKELFVSIGYFVGHERTRSYELTVQTPDGPAIRFDPFSYEDQKMLTAGPFRQSVPVYQVK